VRRRRVIPAAEIFLTFNGANRRWDGVPLNLRAKSAREKADQADQQNKADPAAADHGAAQIETAAAE